MQLDFIGLLGLAFIVLKLTKIANWPWIWVLAPIWGVFALLFVVFVIGTIIVGINSLGQKK